MPDLELALGRQETVGQIEIYAFSFAFSVVFTIITSIINILLTVGLVRKAFNSEISRQDINLKNSKMGEKQIKTVTHSWRVSMKIKSNLNKY